MNETTRKALYTGNAKKITDAEKRLAESAFDWDPDDAAGYIAGDALRKAVNVALALGMPLLVTGEPGTGKTRLAQSIAHDLGKLPLFRFQTKTASEAKDLFYRYDAIRRFQDIQDPEIKPKKAVEQYIACDALGKAILLTKPVSDTVARRYLPDNLKNAGPASSVVLIDEIDKAPRDLPNDILNEFEHLRFTIAETGETFEIDPEYRPVLVLTSNSEKNLPDPFLRRCVFHHIEFPSKTQLRQIVEKRMPGAMARVDAAIKHLVAIRDTLDLKKKPATAEFLAWLSAIDAMGVDLDNLSSEDFEDVVVSYSILAKNRDDAETMAQYLRESAAGQS